MSTHPYTRYADVPYYKKQWFFWLTYFTLTPVALCVLLFGDVYYEKNGEVKVFGPANKVLAALMALGWLVKLAGGFSGMPTSMNTWGPEAERGFMQGCSSKADPGICACVLGELKKSYLPQALVSPSPQLKADVGDMARRCAGGALTQKTSTR